MMDDSTDVPHTQVHQVKANEDCFSEHRGLGVSHIDFKVTPQSGNDLFILENVFHKRGGPARHLHHDQDEWFYALEGEFIIGDCKVVLG